jgi:hypothetical protein
VTLANDRPVLSESAPQQEACNCPTVIKMWCEVPDGCFIPRQTGQMTVGSDITLTLNNPADVVSNPSRCGATAFTGVSNFITSVFHSLLPCGNSDVFNIVVNKNVRLSEATVSPRNNFLFTGSYN